MGKLLVNEIPYHKCPSFDKCSANKCPLDPYINLRDTALGDKKCVAQKPTRMKIGSKYPELLPYKGLTKREWKGKKNWDSLSTAEKALRTEGLAKARKVAKPTLAG